MDEILSYTLYFATYLVYILLIVLFLKFILGASIKSYHSRWNTLIDGFSFSTQEFYRLLTEQLKESGVNRIKTEQVALKEGNAFSQKRTYLRITWKDYQYDVCAAPFGKGFFVSWWLLYKNSLGQNLISKIPFIGSWLALKLYPVTYYKIDTASMFMSYCQQAVLSVIDRITSEQGIRLDTDERKPILNDIFKR